MSDCRERIMSEEVRDFISSRQRRTLLPPWGDGEACIQSIGLIYDSLYVEKDYADPVDFGRYPYFSIPKCYTLIGTEALEQSGILQIQNYPTLQLQGRNILMGFIDTGIEYQNPLFRNLDGSTRIIELWDQTIQSGNPPEGLDYGTVYTKEQINEALESENPLQLVPSRDENGHGTFLASVASGGAAEREPFIGAAPSSSLAVVKLKTAKQYLKEFYEIREEVPCYQENDIMLGMRYLYELAREKQMPLVICIALGTNFGSHNAISPLSGLIELYANTTNTAVIIGAGNEANQRHHYYGKCENEQDIQTIEVRVDQNVSGFVMELWTDVPNVLILSVISPTGERVDRIPINSSMTQTHQFLFEKTRLSVNYKLLVENSNAELIYVRMEQPTEGIWRFEVQPLRIAKGIFHIWLPVTEFLSGEVYFLLSNPDYTITTPGNTLSGITTGYYNGNENSVAIQSGRGYTRSERVKPDFVAPGVNVTGANTRGQLVERTGSSIGVAITAGAVALLMEWLLYQLGEQNVDSIQIRNLLILGTEQNANDIYPNRVWGYGKLNLYNTFEVLRRF